MDLAPKVDGLFLDSVKSSFSFVGLVEQHIGLLHARGNGGDAWMNVMKIRYDHAIIMIRDLMT